ncbi:MAG: hypothetical protein J5I91_03160 [Bacteroidetes bacterium]|nr:hypothetical protein [Bacteroidota bacterium]
MSHTDEVKLYLETLNKDLPLYKESIIEVSKDIRNEGYSEYPIFIATQMPLDLGEQIIDRDDLGTSWSIYASTLEEFAEKGVIVEEKISEFKKAWKNPATHACIFLITPLGASFLFIPFKKHKIDYNFNLN